MEWAMLSGIVLLCIWQRPYASKFFRKIFEAAGDTMGGLSTHATKFELSAEADLGEYINENKAVLTKYSQHYRVTGIEPGTKVENKQQ